MFALKQRILADGKVLPGGVVKVDSFLNHQLDPSLIVDIGREFAGLFREEGITRILTLEASGIPVAFMAGLELGVPVVFAKKVRAKTQDAEVYWAVVHSFTKGIEYDITVSKAFLEKSDRILIIDDFLALGEAARGLVSIIEQAGASLAGIGIVIEKVFQGGGAKLRAQGIRVESLAMIENITEDGHIVFSEV